MPLWVCHGMAGGGVPVCRGGGVGGVCRLKPLGWVDWPSLLPRPAPFILPYLRHPTSSPTYPIPAPWIVPAPWACYAPFVGHRLSMGWGMPCLYYGHGTHGSRACHIHGHGPPIACASIELCHAGGIGTAHIVWECGGVLQERTAVSHSNTPPPGWPKRIEGVRFDGAWHSPGFLLENPFKKILSSKNPYQPARPRRTYYRHTPRGCTMGVWRGFARLTLITDVQ